MYFLPLLIDTVNPSVKGLSDKAPTFHATMYCIFVCWLYPNVHPKQVKYHRCLLVYY